MMRILCTVLFSFLVMAVQAQHSPVPSSEIHENLLKLNTLGSVLYIAAHPDDENTRLIAWLSKNKKYETAYLSLTRGDGGQNLIGNEKWEYMGLLRTQELLEARKQDGGTQFFTRAVDFGYSKTAEESLEKWDEEHILFDMVWVIRKFQPDMLVTRFPPTKYGGHGHHIASAILAEKAFDMAGDSTVFPEQLAFVAPWSPKSLYFNNSTWWDKELPEKAAANPEILQLEVGDFNASLGKWHNQIAMESRSMHKSQGFGAALLRGSQTEYLTHVKGEKFSKELLETVDTDWTRLPDGKGVKKQLDKVIKKYDFTNPSASVPSLLKLYATLSSMESSVWLKRKKEALAEIILQAGGVFLEVNSAELSATSGSSIGVELRAVASNENVELKLNSLRVLGQKIDVNASLPKNELYTLEKDVAISSGEPVSQPYWLQGEFENEFHTPEPWNEFTGSPSMQAKMASVSLVINDVEVAYHLPLKYRYVDRAVGELYANFVVTPSFTANPSDEMLLVADTIAHDVAVSVRSFEKGALVVRPLVPNGWELSPKEQALSFSASGQVKPVVFSVRKMADTKERGVIEWRISSSKNVSNHSYKSIDYSHIEKQVMFPMSTTELIPLSINVPTLKVAYVPGTGDEVADYLSRIGMNVTTVLPGDISSTNLDEFDAVILGIRVYNKHESVASAQPSLMEYVKRGGNLVVQYNTNRGLKVDPIGPYPVQLSRDRVTMENAKPTLLRPKHQLMMYPNQISQADFDNWVQERGLYFADEWDEHYVPFISWHDKGETPSEGGLLLAHYGQGSFIYTGISFFRQLPAGVPGAFRLLVNLVAYEQVESVGTVEK